MIWGALIPSENPGVYHFKQGFSGQDVSRIAPIESCEDFISAIGMRTMDFIRGGFRNSLKKAPAKPASPVGLADGMSAGKTP